MSQKNRRKKLFANKLHRNIFLIVSLASLLPVIIVSICLYFLIFNVTAQEVGIPEAVAYIIIPAAKKVTIILLTAAPLTILAILILAYNMAHRIVGPFDRVAKELDQVIEGKLKGHLTVRRTDKIWPLVQRINRLLDNIK